ncbi:MAG: lytic transglycosylase domain-containing protein, partial [Desulfobacterales bacterium]|nr:lytic transglycosylase domain-containing protein [Desulfobacterales bacterium]
IYITHDVHAETLSLPLTIDYPMLKALVVKSAFKDGNERRILSNKPCVKLIVSEPQFSMQRQKLVFETHVYIHSGIELLGKCRVPVEWEGVVVLLENPLINNQWMLRFKSVDSAIYNKDRQKKVIPNVVWDIIKTSVYDFLYGIQIDLAFPREEFRSFFKVLFPEESQAEAEQILRTMRMGTIIAGPDGLKGEILIDVPDGVVEKTEAPKISMDKLKEFIGLWETWDTFIVQLFMTLYGKQLTDEDRDTLFEVLLEIRYQFIQGLLENNVKKDFVRDQFIRSWKTISSIFKGHLSTDPKQNLLGYFAFFTSADALEILDKLGPRYGLDITRNGLMHLAALVTDEDKVSLTYRKGVNLNLRAILGLGEPIALNDMTYDVNQTEIEIPADEDSQQQESLPEETIPKEDESIFPDSTIPIDPNNPNEPAEPMTPIQPESKSAYFRNLFFLMPFSLFDQPAFAAEKPTVVKLDDIKQWVYKGKDMMAYLERVKAVIDEKQKSVWEKNKYDDKYRVLFQKVAYAGGWQESCFRQFKQEKGKTIYLRSYNGSSVGLMQINEKVWRGIYAEPHLRWDISYNANAGCEIFFQYLTRYVLKKLKDKPPVPDSVLASGVYAIYNGGPGDFLKFLNRYKTGKLYMSDKLFADKYKWVEDNDWNKLEICLGTQ